LWRLWWTPKFDIKCLCWTSVHLWFPQYSSRCCLTNNKNYRRTRRFCLLRIWDDFGYSRFFLKYHNKLIFNVICRHIWFCSINSVKMRGDTVHQHLNQGQIWPELTLLVKIVMDSKIWHKMSVLNLRSSLVSTIQ
jgi:hypothetical protein